MKTNLLKMGQVSLVMGLCVFASCKQADDYFAIESFIEGADAYCSEATDANSCNERVGCQVALNGAEDTNGDTSFGACIADPDYFPDTDGGAGGSGGSSDGGADGGSNGGASGGTAGGTNGGSAGGSAGGSTGGSGDPDVPTIPDAYNSKCQNLDSQYMYVKVTKSKKGTTVEKKVKVCHMHGNGDSHSIIIACPALKAHVGHHDDYLGACHP